jgi:hypothetical protein
MHTQFSHRDNSVQMSANANKRYHVTNESNKRRKTNTRKDQVETELPITSPCVLNMHSERELPRPQLTPKIVLASSVLADVYVHNATMDKQTTAPLSRMFSHDGSTAIKSTLLNNTILSVQFSSCILPARDDIQIVCGTN